MSVLAEDRELVIDPEGLSRAQLAGTACVVCHKRWPAPSVRVGRLPSGEGVKACWECAATVKP
ncbi:MAG: hypothetical protein QOE54_3960 [Streptosporangiaceae bacterium]|nr:hypothetical protein [Streptosporangiaceae bacterium]